MRCVYNFRWHLLALAQLLIAFAAAGEVEWKVPDVLRAWKDPAYAKRFFLEVVPAAEAGSGLLPDPRFASVLLPLNPGEPLLLLNESGMESELSARAEGSETRVVFQTHRGLRHFCLYAGAVSAEARRSPHLKLAEVSGAVKVRGLTAPPDFVYTEGRPLTLERFLGLEKADSALNLGPREMPNIDNPECPYFKIVVGIFGHIANRINPPRYTAIYEGLLRTPVPGEYKFSLDTLGAAHLLVDGKPVISAGARDPARLPFSLVGAVKLDERVVHRLTLYYADAAPDGQTNVDLGLFGLRLHWQPPFADDFLCIPAQAFMRQLPAVVTRMEGGNNCPQPFLNVENLGQVLAGASRGDKLACQRVLLLATPSGAGRGASIAAAGVEDAAQMEGGAFAAWVPAGKEVPLSLQPPTAAGSGKARLRAGEGYTPVVPATSLANRTITFPNLDASSPDLLDLEGELTLKSAPDFLYPDETAHIHLEALLSPPPAIIPKERQETLLLPPPPRPMGQFRLQCWLSDSKTGKCVAQDDLESTPLDKLRCRRRVSIEASQLEAGARSGSTRVVVRLTVGGAEVETLALRLLHAQATWPGTLRAGPDCLLLSPETDGKADPAAQPEQVIMLVPKESESEYRKFFLVKRLERKAEWKEALFVGDPLVEGVTPKPNTGELFGVAQVLAAALPGITWKGVCTPGPHRYLPVFRMIADVEAYERAQPGGKLPALAVLCLGGGDVSRQTPLYTFERALNVLIARLRLAGAKRIVAVSVIPEPTRERQCEPYHNRVAEVMRQHHIECVDIFNTWLREGHWSGYYKLEGAGDTPLYGPVPNAQAREAIAKLIKNQL